MKWSNRVVENAEKSTVMLASGRGYKDVALLSSLSIRLELSITHSFR